MGIPETMVCGSVCLCEVLSIFMNSKAILRMAVGLLPTRTHYVVSWALIPGQTLASRPHIPVPFVFNDVTELLWMLSPNL